jgi:post-segregation antitoxin (ccd killing protein)
VQVVLSIRIPKELKERMERYKIDWKRVITEAIEEKLRQLEAEEALRELDKLNEGIPPAPTPSWRLIREDRDSN